MKAKGFLIALSVLLLFVSAAPVGRTRAGDKTIVTSTERFDPFGLFGPAVGQILSPGIVMCPGAEPTGDPLQPCPPGSRTHVRGSTFVSRIDSTDPSLNGDMSVTLNYNFDADYTGPAWGTFSMALDAGGTWDGTFEGRRTLVGDHWVLPLHVSGRGTGGAVDGMQMMAVDVITINFPVPFAYTGAIEARIHDPHAK